MHGIDVALSVLLGFASALDHPHIVVYVADDLGYETLFSNATRTPNIDDLISQGVTLTDYYQWRLCGPSRCVGQSG